MAQPRVPHTREAYELYTLYPLQPVLGLNPPTTLETSSPVRALNQTLNPTPTSLVPGSPTATLNPKDHNGPIFALNALSSKP